MKVHPQIPTSVQLELNKSVEALQILNGSQYKFCPVKSNHSPYLLPKKDLHPFLFVALMISSLILTDSICRSIFGEC